MHRKQIWVVGAGRFGCKAADTLKQKVPDADVSIIESNPGICEKLKTSFSKIICADGISYLAGNLKDEEGPDWIVPMIPAHVAFEWVKIKLAASHQITAIPVPASVASRLPNAIAGPEGQIYASNADFVCPPNCSEPDAICAHTGKPRPLTLHRFLETVRYRDYRSIVLRSHQLFAGIGGYVPADLFEVLKMVISQPSPVLLSTACRCHGVMHAFETRKL